MKKIKTAISFILASTFVFSSCSTKNREEQTTTSVDYLDIIASEYEEDMHTLYESTTQSPDVYFNEEPFMDAADEDKIKSWQEAHDNLEQNAVTTTEIVEEAGFTPYISNATGIYDGIAILETQISNNSNDEKYYSFDYYKKSFVELNITELPKHYSGTTAIMDDGSIISLITGETILTPNNDYSFIMTGDVNYNREDNGSYHHYKGTDRYYFDGYIIVFKEEEKFNGNIYSIGVIDDKGNWTVPLSSDLEIFEYVDFDECSRTYTYLGNNIIEIGDYAYSYLDDEVICETYGDAEYANSDKIYIKGFSDYIVYDRSTGEYSDFSKDIEWISDSGILLENYNDGNYNYSIIDHNGNTLFDLSEYDVAFAYKEGCLQFTKNNVAFSAKGESGDIYFCVLNNSGEFEFEPIKCGEPNYFLDENRILLYFDNFSIYNFETKTTTKITTTIKDTTLYTSSYNPETDIFLCSSKIMPPSALFYEDSYFYIDSNGNTILDYPLIFG